MVTITFYSYKGGVGRSLALANIASRLSEFEKKVCLIDFDLEAPGLQYKFSSKQPEKVKLGIVDYIYSFSNEGNLPKSILDYTIKVNPNSQNSPIYLIPAGQSDSKEYWQKVSLINWHNLLFDNVNGLAFFVDLKEKIRREIEPDFLLIDSRTGISEMSGITIKLMADEVVIVAANNRENLDGAKKIISSINDSENSIFGKTPKITFVLSRIPFTDKPTDRAKEQLLVANIRDNFGDLYKDEIVVVHSDRELEENERLKINSETEDGITSISKDYLKLFGKIIEKYLKPNEIKKFNIIKEAERIYRQALSKDKEIEQLELISEAIRMVPTNVDYLFFRAYAYDSLKNYESALKDYLKILELDKMNLNAIRSIGDIYFELENFEKSFKFYNMAIELDPEDYYTYFRKALLYDRIGKEEEEINEYEKALKLNPNNSDIYNNMANHYRNKGNIDKAFELIYRALELNPGSAYSYTTMAEIYAGLNKINEFYLNLELALINKNDDDDDALTKVFREENVYQNFYKEQRFKKLLEKYNISLADVTD